MNGLRHSPSRQALFRKVPATMEEAIYIALVEEQSYNSALATAYYRPSSEKSDATPMELGNADVICYKCGKRGHMMARCYAKVASGAKAISKGLPTRRDVRKTSVHDARVQHLPKMGREMRERSRGGMPYCRGL